jgi:predicted nucleic acid-binding protein
MFFRNQPLVVKNFNAYIQEYGKINISIITYYEIVSGLKHRDAQKQLTSFLEFASYNVVLPLTIDSTTISADIYAMFEKNRTYAIVIMGKLVRDTKSIIFRFKLISVSHTLQGKCASCVSPKKIRMHCIKAKNQSYKSMQSD